MLDIGQNIILNDKDIIGIFDLDNITVAKDSRDFLSNAEKSKKTKIALNPLSAELPKSLIITQNENEETIYISQLSTSIIKKRCEIFK